MNTFLTYPNDLESSRSLDYRRLGKQRVETLQLLQTILKGDLAKGWKNHPSTKIWRDHPFALAIYGVSNCFAWTDLGYKDSCGLKISELVLQLNDAGLLKSKESAFIDEVGRDVLSVYSQLQTIVALEHASYLCGNTKYKWARPDWYFDQEVHSKYRASLLYKSLNQNPNESTILHYKRFTWSETPEYGYKW
jgi:hypothetical protein